LAGFVLGMSWLDCVLWYASAGFVLGLIVSFGMRRLGSSLVCVGLAASPPSIHMSVSYVVVSPGAFGAMMNN